MPTNYKSTAKYITINQTRHFYERRAEMGICSLAVHMIQILIFPIKFSPTSTSYTTAVDSVRPYAWWQNFMIVNALSTQPY